METIGQEFLRVLGQGIGEVVFGLVLASLLFALIIGLLGIVLPLALPRGPAVVLGMVFVAIGLFVLIQEPNLFVAGWTALVVALTAARAWRLVAAARQRGGGKDTAEGQEGRVVRAGDPVEPTTYADRIHRLLDARPLPRHRADEDGEEAADSPPEVPGDYRRLSLADLRLPDELRERLSVWALVRHPASFLVMPRSYVVARTRDGSAPALSVTAILDPSSAEASLVTFEAGVAPELLPYHVELVHDHLREHLREQEADPAALVLHLPSDLEAPPEVQWDDPMTRLASVVRDGEALVLRVVARSMGKAHAVMQRLRPGPRHHGLAVTIRFDLGQSGTATASLFIDLGRTTGEALKAEVAPDGKVEIANLTESPVALKSLLHVWPEGRRPAIQRLIPERIIDASETVVLERPEGVEKVCLDYEVRPPEDRALPELRVDIGELDIRLAVETDLQPAERFPPAEGMAPEALAKIVVEIEPEGRAPATAVLERDGEHFLSEVVVLRVPLDRYLEPEHRTVRYTVCFVFRDGSRLLTDRREMNYSDPRLIVRRQTLLEIVNQAARRAPAGTVRSPDAAGRQD
jgi:membrane protein implicated in regulation of membrane protease activity